MQRNAVIALFTVKGSISFMSQPRKLAITAVPFAAVSATGAFADMDITTPGFAIAEFPAGWRAE